MKLLLYCTKAKPYLLDLRKTYEEIKFDLFNKKDKLYRWNTLNGLIVAECDFEAEERLNYGLARRSETELKGTCLTMEQLDKYLPKHKEYDDKDVYYYIHIKNLNIFDELMGLSEYSKKVEYKKCDNCEEHCKFYYSKNTMSGETNTGCTRYYPIQKAPQNMCYCYDASGNKYVLISIHPEHLCKILNGEKKIEVRKKVLKEML